MKTVFIEDLLVTKNILDQTDLEINIWHGSIKQGLAVVKRSSGKKKLCTHSILFNNIPAFELKSIGNDFQFFTPRKPFMLLIPHNVELKFATKTDGPIRLIELLFCHEKQGIDIPDREIYFRKTPLEAILEIENLISFCLQIKPDVDQITKLREKILKACISEFFMPSELTKVPLQHSDKMELLRDILQNSLQADLPHLVTLARETGMTVSTMKRHFKLHFGQNIYQYYLQKKMELAKKLLHEDGHTVNETAELLGYASVSNFIDIFKKYNGQSPGKVKSKGSA